MKISLPKETTDKELYQVRNYVQEHNLNDVDIDPERKIIGFTTVAFTSAGILLCTIVRFCYTIHKDRKAENIWNHERLEKLMKDEMLKYDQINFELVKVENYQGLLDNTFTPCTVTISDANDEMYQFNIYRDGRIFRIEKN